MKKLLFILALLFLPSSLAWSNSSAQGWCELGGTLVVFSGFQSSNTVQGSFPQCTVTVNVHGGGLATIFADNSGTALGNPFTASTTGRWQFYAANGRYDVTLGGAGMPSPVTYSDIILLDTAPGVTTLPQCSVSFSATPAFTANSCAIFSMTLTGNVTSSSVTGATVGQVIDFSLTQGAGGPWTFAWPANFVNPPLLTPIAAKAMSCEFVLLTDNNWHSLGCGESNVFDTAVNGNVLRINGNGLTAVSGSGTTALLQTSPAITTPTITNPTISGGGSLAGTFTGTPTISLSASSSVPIAALTGTPLLVNQGGTGAATFTSNGILYGNGTGAIQVTAAGGAGTLCLLETNGGNPLFSSCSGVASTAWNSITAPAGNTAFNLGTFTTTITGGVIGGSPATNVWTLNDTTGNTTTGCLFCVNTVGTSTALPIQFTAQGTANGIFMNTSGVIQKLGTGGIADAALSSNVALISNTNLIFKDEQLAGRGNENITITHTAAPTSTVWTFATGDNNSMTFAGANASGVNATAPTFITSLGTSTGSANGAGFTWNAGFSGGAASTLAGGFTFNGGNCSLGGNCTGGTFAVVTGTGTGTGSGGQIQLTVGGGGGAGVPGNVQISGQSTFKLPLANSIINTAWLAVANGRLYVSEGTAASASVAHGIGSNIVNNCPFQGPLGALTGNSAAQVIYSCTLKGNQMLAGKGVRCTTEWTHSVGTAAIAYTITYGGANIGGWSDAGTATTTYLRFGLFNNPGVTNAQSNVVEPIIQSTAIVIQGGVASSAIDSTADQTLAINFNVANTDQVTPKAFYCELEN